MSKTLKQNSSLPLPQPRPLLRWFKDSETILLARAQTGIGFLVTATAAMNWSPLVGTNLLDTKQTIALGTVLMVQGVLTEWARRINDPFLKAKNVR